MLALQRAVQHPATHDRDKSVKDESYHDQIEHGTTVPRLREYALPIDSGIIPEQGYDESPAPSGHNFRNQYFQQDRAGGPPQTLLDYLSPCLCLLESIDSTDEHLHPSLMSVIINK